MKRLTVAILATAIMTVAAPALASQTVTIDHEFGPRIVDRQVDEGNETRADIVGSFLRVSFADPEDFTDSDQLELVSVDVSDPTITGAVIHDDGTVTLVRAVEDEPETIDLVERFPGTITKLPSVQVS